MLPFNRMRRRVELSTSIKFTFSVNSSIEKAISGNLCSSSQTSFKIRSDTSTFSSTFCCGIFLGFPRISSLIPMEGLPSRRVTNFTDRKHKIQYCLLSRGRNSLPSTVNTKYKHNPKYNNYYIYS